MFLYDVSCKNEKENLIIQKSDMDYQYRADVPGIDIFTLSEII
jgi:hypothetical protein